MKQAAIKKNDYFNYILPLATLFSIGFLVGLQYDLKLLRIICKPTVLIIYMLYIALCADFNKIGVCFIFIGHIFSLLGMAIIKSRFQSLNFQHCF